MPKLSDFRKEIELTAPSGMKIKMYNTPLYGEYAESQTRESNEDQIIYILSKIITDWDFVSDDDKKLEINEKNLKLVPIADMTFLMNSFTDLVNKKKET